MTNHLRQPQETQLQRYFVESLILQGFQTAKNRVFCTFLPSFLHILEVLSVSYIRKNAEILILSTFQSFTIFFIKTDNPLILSMLISLVYAGFFVMTEGLKLTVFYL